jgi:hypothetical protein
LPHVICYPPDCPAGAEQRDEANQHDKRKELVEALRARYRDAAVADKVKILDEFVALTGYHRKHAIRVLREEVTSKEARERNRLYDEAVRQALTVLWEAADRV